MLRILEIFFLVDGSRSLDLISDLMILLGHGGFFHDNGLNSLPSIKYIASLLSESDLLTNVNPIIEKTFSFVTKRKFILRSNTNSIQTLITEKKIQCI